VYGILFVTDMSKQRYINTKFWSDTYVVELNPLDRYLFLYLLTNEHTNIAGIYELPLIRMAQESGIDKEMLPKMLKRLSDKVKHIDGWVIIKNFQKHQQDSEKIKIGIENKMNEIPTKITDFYKKWLEENNMVFIPYDRVSIESELLEPKLKPKPKLNSNPNPYGAKQSFAGEIINKIISLFKEINPSIGKYYKNISQRNAVERMLEQFGREKLEEMIKALPIINARPYWPKSTTPIELENNIGKYKAMNESDKNKKSESKIKVAIIT
jgi:hypothetical protein